MILSIRRTGLRCHRTTRLVLALLSLLSLLGAGINGFLIHHHRSGWHHDVAQRLHHPQQQSSMTQQHHQRRQLINLYLSNQQQHDDDENVAIEILNDISNFGVNVDLLTELNQKFQYDGRLDSSMLYNELDQESYTCGYVSIIGAPNMGKSTLMNAFLEENLCIITARPQTTRHAIIGLVTTNTTQICFIDTPGIISNPAYQLQSNMMEAVMSSFYNADIHIIVTDLFSTPIPDDELFQKVQKSPKPKIIVINKIDLQDKVNTTKTANDDDDDESKISVTPEQAIEVWRRLVPDALAIIPVCAMNGPKDVGVMAVRNILTSGPNVGESIRRLGRPIPGMFSVSFREFTDAYVRQQLALPISPPLYDPTLLTDKTERFIASEIIRSVLFTSFHKELPYCCEVQVTEFKEKNEPKQSASATTTNNDPSLIKISANIIVERDSQKIIVIGKGGEQIKKIGIEGRIKLEEFFQSKVYLNLNVKVSKDWRRKDDVLKEFGYV